MKQHLPAFAFTAILIALIAGCTVTPVSQTTTSYVQFKKTEKDTAMSYILPVIEPTVTTKQSQTKGDITITAELVPFTVTQSFNQTRALTYSDKSSYDIYEVTNTPVYSITPNQVQFKIRVRNNSVKVLRLIGIGVGLIIDGKSISFDDAGMRSWNSGLVLSGFEQEYLFKGPYLDALQNPKAVFLTIQDVPVIYNQASGISKTENFEWFFECKTEPIVKHDKITYSYDETPVLKERCSACSGMGYHEIRQTCTWCSGTGTITGSDGKVYRCSRCEGTKIMVTKETCVNCVGKGMIAYPKSTRPPVANRTTWNGWRVNIVTHPAGALVSTVSFTTKEYTAIGRSNELINWYTPSGEQYPIQLECMGKIVKVLPYTADGKPSARIVVDFTKGDPIVKVGKEVK